MPASACDCGCRHEATWWPVGLKKAPSLSFSPLLRIAPFPVRVRSGGDSIGDVVELSTISPLAGVRRRFGPGCLTGCDAPGEMLHQLVEDAVQLGGLGAGERRFQFALQ